MATLTYTRWLKPLYKCEEIPDRPLRIKNSKSEGSAIMECKKFSFTYFWNKGERKNVFSSNDHGPKNARKKRLSERKLMITSIGEISKWEAILFERGKRIYINLSRRCKMGLRWTENYLRDTFSDLVGIFSGIPQGSVLVPLLLLVCVKDLPEWVESYLNMFVEMSKVTEELRTD